jgi:hypothetical protein
MYNELFQTKRRGYDGAKILDLLRAIRNKVYPSSPWFVLLLIERN